MADQLFTEKVDLSALNPTARLHLFRYMEQRHLEKPDYLLNLPKAKRERIFYRAFLTPLLKSKLKGQEFEPALKECIKALRRIPEKQREERLARFKMCLEAFPSINKGFGSLFSCRASPEKLAFLHRVGVSFTDGSRLSVTLSYSLEQLGWLKDFPLLDISVVVFSDYRVHHLVEEIPALSQCTSEEEYKEIQRIAFLTDGKKWEIYGRFKKFTAAFPKLNCHWGFLLAGLEGLSDQKVNEVITFMKGNEPFSNLTSGAMLGFFITKVGDG